MDIKHKSFPNILVLCGVLLLTGSFPTYSKANPNNHTSRNTIIKITSLANAGRAEAQYRLGKLYLKGQDVSQNYSKAREWLQRAAEQKHARSQNQLGIIYADGLGVDKSCKIAKFWFNQIEPGNYVFKQAQGNLAWVLSTCSASEERNGKKAVKITQKLLTEQEKSSPGLLDTLAAAYAETGQFEQAILIQQQAIVLLPISTDDKSATRMNQFKQRLKNYQQDMPWRSSL